MGSINQSIITFVKQSIGQSVSQSVSQSKRSSENVLGTLALACSCKITFYDLNAHCLFQLHVFLVQMTFLFYLDSLSFLHSKFHFPGIV